MGQWVFLADTVMCVCLKTVALLEAAEREQREREREQQQQQQPQQHQHQLKHKHQQQQQKQIIMRPIGQQRRKK